MKLRAWLGSAHSGWVLAYLALFLAVPAPAGAQEPSRLERAKLYYQAEQYGKTIIELEAALVHSSNYSQEELATLYLYLGLAYLNMGRPERARQSFAESLRMDQELEVDPTLRSPEVAEVFERARWVVEEEAARWQEDDEEKVPLGQAIETPSGPTGKTRWGGIWRSTLLPGWGQIYGERTLRGYAFMGVELASLVTALYASRERDRAYDAYEEARATSTPDRINALYDDYKSQERTRNTLLVVAGGIWALNILESMLNDPSIAREDRVMRDWQLGAAPKRDGWSVQVRHSF
jgi:tetratricopeptide (TPR) repeat protein